MRTSNNLHKKYTYMFILYSYMKYNDIIEFKIVGIL